MKSAKSWATAAAAVTVVAWASAFPLIRIAMRELQPMSLAAARFLIAGAIFGLWFGLARPKIPPFADLLRFVVCALIGIVAYNYLLNAGERSVTAAAASFIMSCVPILTAILATVFLGERFSLIGWLGSAVSLLGVVVIASRQPGGMSFGADAWLVLAAAVAQASYFVIQRPLVRTHGAVRSTAFTLIAAALLLLPWTPNALRELSVADVSTLGSVLALGIIPAALGYVTWSYALNHFGAAKAANFLYLVPPVAALLAFVLAGEAPTFSTLWGGALAMSGVFIVSRFGKHGTIQAGSRSG